MTAPDRVTYVGHGTALIEVGGVRLLTDPVLGRRLGPLVRHGLPPEPAIAQHLDAVLISHLHRDHADRGSQENRGVQQEHERSTANRLHLLTPSLASTCAFHRHPDSLSLNALMRQWWASEPLKSPVSTGDNRRYFALASQIWLYVWAVALLSSL